LILCFGRFLARGKLTTNENCQYLQFNLPIAVYSQNLKKGGNKQTTLEAAVRLSDAHNCALIEL
jgi:hypothetical protein